MSKIIAYLRVSTQHQQKTGNGIEAQRTAIGIFAQANGLEIVDEFVETETGKGADALERRPKLRAALEHAKEISRREKMSVSVAVSKLDRLSRDVHFIRAGLRSTGIISAGLEVIYAFRRFEDIGAGVEGDQQARDGSFGDFA